MSWLEAVAEQYKHDCELPDYAESSDGTEVEVCPHCEREIRLRWNINEDGFKAFCPHCGKRLMLCDACQHRFGEFHDDCDYCTATDTCRFNKEGDK